jgi:hypothetical protein
MAYGDPQLLHLDSMLTDISVGFDNPDQFVASMLFPQVGVAKQSDRYYVYNRDLWGRVTDDIRAPGSEANELSHVTATSPKSTLSKMSCLMRRSRMQTSLFSPRWTQPSV